MKLIKRTIFSEQAFLTAFLPRHIISYIISFIIAFSIGEIGAHPYVEIATHPLITTATVISLHPEDHDTYHYEYRIGNNPFYGISLISYAYNDSGNQIFPHVGNSVRLWVSEIKPALSCTENPRVLMKEALFDNFIIALCATLVIFMIIEKTIKNITTPP